MDGTWYVVLYLINESYDGTPQVTRRSLVTSTSSSPFGTTLDYKNSHTPFELARLAQRPTNCGLDWFES